MAKTAPLLGVSDQRKRWPEGSCLTAHRQEERQTMSVPEPRSRWPKPLAAGVFQPEIGSFRLALAHLIPQASRTRWEQVSGQDVQRWMVWLLGRYSDSYASNQYRALQQFFRWWAEEEEELPDPMARLHPPKVTEKLIPVFTSVELSKLERACQGRSFAQRRDHRRVPGDWHPALGVGRDPLRRRGYAA